ERLTEEPDADDADEDRRELEVGRRPGPELIERTSVALGQGNELSATRLDGGDLVAIRAFAYVGRDLDGRGRSTLGHVRYTSQIDVSECMLTAGRPKLMTPPATVDAIPPDNSRRFGGPALDGRAVGHAVSQPPTRTAPAADEDGRGRPERPAPSELLTRSTAAATRHRRRSIEDAPAVGAGWLTHPRHMIQGACEYAGSL